MTAPSTIQKPIEPSLAPFPILVPVPTSETARAATPELKLVRPRRNNQLGHFYPKYCKHSIEGLLCVALGIVAIPIFLLASLIVAIEQRSLRRIIYSQTRLGLDGNSFQIFKLRTMVLDAEANGPAFSSGATDTRITKVGRILRRYRIDELPQLWNVMRGDMALIGPRPERPEFSSYIEKMLPDFDQRLLVRPGITGLAQVSAGYIGADMKGHADKLSFDLEYIDTVSVRRDLGILVRTVHSVLTAQGQ
jgi:lipopolysaccharide/colanic/teichoic acid biosynthesis glycosyltransferase